MCSSSLARSRRFQARFSSKGSLAGISHLSKDRRRLVRRCATLLPRYAVTQALWIASSLLPSSTGGFHLPKPSTASHRECLELHFCSQESLSRESNTRPLLF